MTAISYLAKEEGIIVIATIHQPSLETLAQFTNLMFLGEGKMCYLGRVDELDGFFERWGRPVGRFVSCNIEKIYVPLLSVAICFLFYRLRLLTMR